MNEQTPVFILAGITAGVFIGIMIVLLVDFIQDRMIARARIEEEKKRLDKEWELLHYYAPQVNTDFLMPGITTTANNAEYKRAIVIEGEVSDEHP